VLVKRVEAEEKMKGGIIIPDTAKEKPMEGKVIAVGSGRLDDNGKRVAMEVKAGDRILFGKYAGTEIKIEDEEHIILREDEILGLIDSHKEESPQWLQRKSSMPRSAARQSSRASTSWPTPSR
jgi:chaperonin GroES